MTAEQMALVGQYVTDVDGGVFALTGLPEEVIAVLFAYYSRSRHGLRENLAKLLEDDALAIGGATSRAVIASEKAAAFHEKWVVGYGHSSVAEHAVIHLGLEGVSILASKAVEDCRLASFTEKSTRYVQFERGACPPPPGILGTEHEARFTDAVDALFGAYDALLPIVTAEMNERGARNPKAKALDVLRCLLPTATQTNIGATVNARTCAHMIRKLAVHPLPECRDLAAKIRREATKVVPTLVRHAEPSEHALSVSSAVPSVTADLAVERSFSIADHKRIDGFRIHSPDVVTEVCASIVAQDSGAPYDSVIEGVRRASDCERFEILDAYLGGRGEWDAVGRALESVTCSFDCIVDYGAYRDIQRHRMCTQYPQPLGVDLGLHLPPELDPHLEVIAPALNAVYDAYYALLPSGQEVASYVLPMAFNIRVRFVMNLRELVTFIELRSKPQGHDSYRQVARELFDEIQKSAPLLAGFVQCS